LTLSKNAFAGASQDILDISNVNNVSFTVKPLSITSNRSIINGLRNSSIKWGF